MMPGNIEALIVAAVLLAALAVMLVLDARGVRLSWVDRLLTTPAAARAAGAAAVLAIVALGLAIVTNLTPATDAPPTSVAGTPDPAARPPSRPPQPAPPTGSGAQSDTHGDLFAPAGRGGEVAASRPEPAATSPSNVPDPDAGPHEQEATDAVTHDHQEAADEGDGSTPSPSPPVSEPWASLADCESGNWIDGGAAFETDSARWRWGAPDKRLPPWGTDLHHGGLQFAPTTWTWVAGDVLDDPPTYAYDATPAEQVQVATEVQRRQGWGAWPTCGPLVGLT